MNFFDEQIIKKIILYNLTLIVRNIVIIKNYKFLFLKDSTYDFIFY